MRSLRESFVMLSKMVNRMGKTYSYILLDWDGCIAQTLELWPTAQVESFRQYGIHVTFDEAIKSCRGTWQYLYENFDIPEEKAMKFLRIHAGSSKSVLGTSRSILAPRTRSLSSQSGANVSRS